MKMSETKQEPIRENVATIEQLYQIIEAHGNDDQHDFDGFPYGENTDRDCIGQATCNDGVIIDFYAPDEEMALKIYNQMF
jgi:hypothetical protein